MDHFPVALAELGLVDDLDCSGLFGLVVDGLADLALGAFAESGSVDSKVRWDIIESGEFSIF